MTGFDNSRDCARALDAADRLSRFRQQFNFPEDRDGRACVYLCGNSLGLQPKGAVERVQEALDDWARFAVEGHFKAARPWLSYHREATGGLAELTGAQANEVVTMNTLTVNLHVMMASFYRPDATRRKIIIESTAFPSDYFAVASQIRLHGLDPDDCLVEWKPREDELLHTEDLADLLRLHSGEIALLLLPGVQYYSGQVLDMAKHCEMARQAGAKIGFDLAHAIGNVPLSLHEWGPDFAAWCTYKYLNSGPGAVAGAFVHARHFDDNDTEYLKGWWGHEESTRFRMERQFRPGDGAERWQLSNPPVLAIAPILASLDVFGAAGMAALHKKSMQQTEYLEYLLEQQFSGQIGSITPPDARGCQLSLVVTDKNLNARALFKRLEHMNVIGDWREPNVIRVAPVPLYNSFEDIYEFTERLITAIDNG
ncbi:MAG: kynureninase [Woeseiaceae bacterium]